MRLNEKETASIREILRGADPAGKIILFGSRADDDRRGGDIDLFFKSSRPMSLREKLLLEYRLSSTLDTKVDLLVKPAQEADRPIHRAARKGAPPCERHEHRPQHPHQERLRLLRANQQPCFFVLMEEAHFVVEVFDHLVDFSTRKGFLPKDNA